MVVLLVGCIQCIVQYRICCTLVRLVDGSTSQDGRLEVYYKGVWGTVCDDGFTNASARVVCYMLGYG